MNTSNTDSALTGRTISSSLQRYFRVIPAISARVRYASAPAVTAKPTITASVDIEIATFLNHDIRIERIQLKLNDGNVEDIIPEQPWTLPLISRPRDTSSFLYRLVSDRQLSDIGKATSNSKMLDIAVYATVLASDDCQPCIEMRWRTGVDFALSLNPTFGAPAQPMQRTIRPANISMTQIASNGTSTLGSGQNNSGDETRKRERAVSVSELGVSVTFTAPTEVYVGEPFCWDVFVVNRSSKPRKLGLSVISERKKKDVKTHLPSASDYSTISHKDQVIADAVIKENMLYAAQRDSSKDGMPIICLSNDMKIGYVLSDIVVL